MTDFGLVKADKNLVMLAMNNYMEKSLSIKTSFERIRSECIQEKVVIKKCFGLINKTVSLWDTFASLNEVFNRFDELGGEENISLVYFQNDTFQSILDLSSIINDGVYLTPKQAKFVSFWSSYGH